MHFRANAIASNQPISLHCNRLAMSMSREIHARADVWANRNDSRSVWRIVRVADVTVASRQLHGIAFRTLATLLSDVVLSWLRSIFFFFFSGCPRCAKKGEIWLTHSQCIFLQLVNCEQRKFTIAHSK
jgi:hypothetical protein